MKTITMSPPVLGGWRLLAVLAVAVGAAITSGMALARALPVVAPAWADDPQRVAVVVIAAVYLSVTVVLLAGLGRDSSQRRSWLAINPADPPALPSGRLPGEHGAVHRHQPARARPRRRCRGAVGHRGGRRPTTRRLTSPDALILLRACLLAPVAEELLFRGALFTWLRRRLVASWTIALTAIGFAVIH